MSVWLGDDRRTDKGLKRWRGKTVHRSTVAPPPLTADSWLHAQSLQTIHNAWEKHTQHWLCGSNLSEWTAQMVWILTECFCWVVCDRWVISLNYQGLSSDIFNTGLCGYLYFIMVFYMLAYLQWQAALPHWSSAVRRWCSGTAGRCESWCYRDRSQSSLSIPRAPAPDRSALSAPETNKNSRQPVSGKRGAWFYQAQITFIKTTAALTHIYVQTHIHSPIHTHSHTETKLRQPCHAAVTQRKPAQNSSILG